VALTRRYALSGMTVRFAVGSPGRRERAWWQQSDRDLLRQARVTSRSDSTGS
jgi:hypothetical protein